MSADTKLKCNCCYIQKIDFYAELGKADSKFAEVNCQVKVSSETQYQPIIGKWSLSVSHNGIVYRLLVVYRWLLPARKMKAGTFKQIFS